MLWLLLMVGCADAQPAGGPEANTIAPVGSAEGGGPVMSDPGTGVVTSGSSSETSAGSDATTVGSSVGARVHATVVATWGGDASSWLLVDLAEGEAIEGSTRVVVELDEPDLDCAGSGWPLFVLHDAEQVSFELVPGAVAVGPGDVQDLRWSVTVVVAGRDLRMVCPSRGELAATIETQRARWTAAGVDSYEFTLHWGVSALSAGDYRVTVVDGQPSPGLPRRLDEPVVVPDAPPPDLSEIPQTIEQVFDRLTSALNADRVVACYDQQLGYPLDVLIDPFLSGIDDELTMRISDLTVAGSPIPSVGCETRTPVTGAMACDVYLIGPDGMLGPTPVRAGVRGFSTVARAELPDQVPAGVTFVAEIPRDSQVLTSTAEQFGVVAHRDFLRVFAVGGGSIVAGSVTQTPADNASATSDHNTVSLGLTTPIPGGQEVNFPAARFHVVAPATGTVEVSLLRYESTLDLRNADGSTITIRALCTLDPNVLAATTVA
jgi:Family of unknown function (DUF6174)